MTTILRGMTSKIFSVGRETKGGHQIAIAQATDIERPNGVVSLTTVLLHISGGGSPRNGRSAGYPRYRHLDGWERL